jgi:peptide/nickel transport system substrate-binding protein
LEEARREYDPRKRRVLYGELQHIMHEKQPAAFLYIMPTLMAIAGRFENVVDYPAAPDTNEWKVGVSQTLWEW